MNKEKEIKNLKKIIKFIDKPIMWFVLVIFIGLLVIDVSYSDLSATIIIALAFIVWEYERYKNDK